MRMLADVERRAHTARGPTTWGALRPQVTRTAERYAGTITGGVPSPLSIRFTANP